MIKRYRSQLLACLLLTTMTLFCYWQVQHFDFINLDDTDYVTKNRRVQAGITLEGVKWAFTTNRSANWHPLTWLSHMLDCELYGLNPTGHHWTSLMFHMANSLLLFLVFNQMTGAVWRSAFLAALFALHPLHVESVAWVSERKDVLSTFFGFLSIAAYIGYVRKKRLIFYVPVVLFLCLGLMAKPMLVTLPFVLLLLDYWPLGRFSENAGSSPPSDGSRTAAGGRSLPLVLEKVPLFLLVFLSCIATIMAQGSKGAVQSLEAFSLPVRISNALVSYVKYIYKALWPRQLSVHYFHPGETLPVWQAVCAAFFITGISYWAFRRAREHPYVAVGWCWFLGTLVPVIGLVQVGGQAMADRYTYIPLIGIFVIIAWGASALCSNSSSGRHAMAVCAVFVLSILGMRTHTQAGYWENSITLYENAIRVDGGSDLVHNNFGSALTDRGMFDQAAFHYKKALKINPANEDARNNLANLMAETGNFDEAGRFYRTVIRNNPENAVAHYNFGILLIKQNKPKDAYLHFAESIKIDPELAEAYNYIGVLLARQGKFVEAGAFYAKAIQIDPDLVKARMNFERNKRRLSHE